MFVFPPPMQQNRAVPVNNQYHQPQSHSQHHNNMNNQHHQRRPLHQHNYHNNMRDNSTRSGHHSFFSLHFFLIALRGLLKTLIMEDVLFSVSSIDNLLVSVLPLGLLTIEFHRPQRTRLWASTTSYINETTPGRITSSGAGSVDGENMLFTKLRLTTLVQQVRWGSWFQKPL